MKKIKSYLKNSVYININQKMDKKTIEKRVKMFQIMKQLKRDERLSFLKTCPDECIHALCEVCFNLLHQSLELGKDKKYRLKKKLKPIRVDVRKLANSRLSVKTKRKLLSKPQVGDGIFTILASTIIPALISAIASK